MESDLPVWRCDGCAMSVELNEFDDWTGSRDPKIRRRIQNRINQRAARKRRNPKKLTPLQARLQDIAEGHQILGTIPARSSPGNSAHVHAHDMVQIRTRCWPGTTRLESTRIARPYIELFPLSADHLITLMQHNVYRGFLTNMLLLNLPNIFGCDVNVGHCGLICPLPLPTTLPPTLAPTPLQQRVPHEPWMDLFPLPALRDKLIKAEEPFDSCELCFDILGALVEKNIPWVRSSGVMNADNDYEAHEKGILIWGDPWLLSSWELSEGFWKRWGWLMRGCGDDVMLSTNRWRATRGEQALTLEQTI